MKIRTPNTIESSMPCPCGRGALLPHCCGQWFDLHTPAPTAEALMRSRYSAYVLNRHAYIEATWHPESRPNTLGGTSLHWIGLRIIRTEHGGPNDTHGVVAFIASYLQSTEGKQLHETSRFVQEAGRWFYVDGDYQLSEIAHNAACPCGSGRTFKRCCSKEEASSKR